MLTGRIVAEDCGPRVSIREGRTDRRFYDSAYPGSMIKDLDDSSAKKTTCGRLTTRLRRGRLEIEVNGDIIPQLRNSFARQSAFPRLNEGLVMVTATYVWR